MLFPSDFEMLQLEAMLPLLILAIVGTSAISPQGKSSLKSASLSSGHLISLNPGDMGILPAFATD